ncbi:50S ribosomal subunit protein L34 [Candidatus Nasuia deltocephalinicola]|uniref:Large ribosomal subunit protein bL34 n=1 Tax=Candidatus Nasuia deltocephalincola TaxID=1160784 RepID=A0A0S2UPI0_9PROT|nr:50S ribosomal subunit protein L34 [Candidatus Nasuia deltocephalinicola]
MKRTYNPSNLKRVKKYGFKSKILKKKNIKYKKC